MSWSNVRLIFLRECRDQLRDRRTLFTIAVLPILLYPLLGITFMQVAQFMKEHPANVWVIGGQPESQPLIVGDGFDPQYCSQSEAELINVTTDLPVPENVAAAMQQLAKAEDEGNTAQLDRRRQVVQNELQAREFDALLYFPPNFAEQLAQYRSALRARNELQPADSAAALSPPQVKLFVNMASDKSRIAGRRVENVLTSWREAMVQQNLAENEIPVAATQPFELVNTDIAAEGSRRAAVWSKILPFVMLIWALTGAFYPAIDLCAGEKERGTLETLLCSPALRSEIACGKLLTIILFSISTALLNMISMGATGLLVFQQLGAMSASPALSLGPPPVASVGWLVLAIIPISALFGALSLAIAAFARSSKEGQYYLMPLLLITLPLMVLPMLPAAELDLGTSLIPVTGMMLLLRSLIEGQYLEALRFALPVLGVTFVCCLLSIRWAVSQFNNESVLFRESERWGVGLWLRHVVRDRGLTPTFGEAMMCGVILLVIQFFARLYVAMPRSWHEFFTTTFVTQLAFIATPAMLMAIMLTRSPRHTLLLRMPRLATLPAAVLLALLLHPVMMTLAHFIQWLYPLNEDMRGVLQQVSLMVRGQPLIYVLLLMAVLPAVCEELAFRGFMLSGFRKMGRSGTAIILSSVFFGVTHGLLQQSLAACVLGVVLGYIAVQTGSLLPCILFHATHNSLSLSIDRITPELVAEYPVLRWIFSGIGTNEFGYQWPVVACCALLSVVFLAWWFRRVPHGIAASEPASPSIQPAHAVAK